MSHAFESGTGKHVETVEDLKQAAGLWDVSASVEAVNRTRRVVRERARTLTEQKKRVRSLWIPLTVSFGMLALILVALWNLLDESEFFADGLPDASQQLLMISMWVLPLSVVVLAVIWFRRASVKAADRGPQ